MRPGPTHCSNLPQTIAARTPLKEPSLRNTRQWRSEPHFTYLEPSKLPRPHCTRAYAKLTLPVSLLLGTYIAFTAPTSFINKQIPFTPTSALTPLPATAYILAYTLGSIFGLFALLSILCTALTRDTRVTRYYLAILACGDIGHLYANYKGMGGDIFWDFGAYNEVMVGNVWITVFLWVNRIATLAGMFGKVTRRA